MENVQYVYQSEAGGIPPFTKVEVEQQAGGENRQVISVMSNSHKCPVNSTTTPLAGGGVFTGKSCDVLEYAEITVSVFADQHSATDGIELQFSPDGTTWKTADNYTYSDGGNYKTWKEQIIDQYFRIKYTNGGSAQSSFNLTVLYKKNVGVQWAHRIKDDISGEDDAGLVKSIIAAERAGGTPDVYTNIQATSAGNLKVSLEENEPGVYVAISDLAGENFAEVTTGANTGETGLRVFIGPTDPISDIPVIIPYEHHQIHGGETYQYTYPPTALALNVSVDFRFVVGAQTPTTETPHIVVETDSSVETWVYIYESPTFSDNGTQQTAYNKNRNSSNTPVSTIWLAPTVSTTGSLISSWIVGTGRVGGNSRESLEWDYKASTEYLIRVTAKAASDNVCVRFIWYEDLGV